MSIYTSLLTAGTNSHTETSENANAIATDFVTPGIVGSFTNTAGVAPMTGGFAVNAQGSPNMTVAVSAGIAWVSATPSSQNSQGLRVKNTTTATVTISSNSSGSTKYDWLYINVDATKAANPAVDASDVATLVTSRSSSSTTDNGTPPSYGKVLAVITVANGAVSVTNGNISDQRVVADITASSASNTTGWVSLGKQVVYSANNGNKEFVITSSNDLSSVLSPGMRMKVTRSASPPTQCFAFTAASSQYATKASPSGITFTSAFTCEAWIYVLSYTGQAQGIISRSDNSTGGFILTLNASGQVQISYGASSSFTQFQTYQSVPLNRWVHIAGVVSSVSGKTLQGIYINGASVPTSQTLSAATTLTQTSNLSVGAIGAGVASTFLNGYMSEVRVWSAAQTAANIQANMAINCIGTETNLVALFQGNGNFNDATSNANNLTAQGGASATQANNPYNATEYAVITKVSYSNPTTTVTLFAGTDYTIPNQTLNSPYYSTSKTPYGFPPSRYKWLVDYKFRTTTSIVVTSTSAWYNPGGISFSVPTGDIDAQALFYGKITATAVAYLGTIWAISTSNSSVSNDDLEMQGTVTAASVGENDAQFKIEGLISNTAITTYYPIVQPVAVNSTTTAILGTASGASTFRFFSAYI